MATASKVEEYNQLASPGLNVIDLLAMPAGLEGAALVKNRGHFYFALTDWEPVLDCGGGPVENARAPCPVARVVGGAL